MAYLACEENKSIYYEYYAGPGEAIMLVHGFGMHVRAWDPVIAVLRQAGYAVIAFDQRGCGKSDKDFTVVTVSESARDVVRLADHLGLNSVILNGWSLGGAISVAAADILGSRCRAVVSTCGATPRMTNCADWSWGQPEGTAAGMCAGLAGDRALVLAGFEAAMFSAPVDPAIMHWAGAMLYEAAQSADTALLDLESLDQRDILAKLEVPFFSIVGAQDKLVPADVGRQAALIAPKGTKVELEQSGHAPFLEQREEYNAALIQFLASVV